jgi:hypothetical protein
MYFNQDQNLKTLLLLLVMGVLMQLPASSQPSLLGVSTIPLGYSDTAASGAIKAKQDLARGEVKYAVYGMPMRSYVDKLVSDGVTPILMGCLVGGAGSPFWRGYNAYMESKFPMLEPVLTLGVLGRS